MLCVVTRYFGGIKLGAGGLIRAYSEATSNGVNNIVDLTEIIEKTFVTIQISYDLVNVIMKAMANYTLVTKEFLNDVKLTYELPLSELDNVKENIINQSNGKAIIL